MLACPGREEFLSEVLLTVEGLKKFFPIPGKIFSKQREHVRAVDGVSFKICKGETFSLVGESGCGKTTAGKSIIRLIEPTSGNVWLRKVNLAALDEKGLRRMRKEMQIVFQDPFSSLNPRMTVDRIIGEALTIHHLADKRDREEKAAQVLDMVGLGADHLYRYPMNSVGDNGRELELPGLWP